MRAARSISSCGVKSFTWPISRRYSLMAVSPSYEPRSRPRGTRSSVSAGLIVASFMPAGESASARASGLASTSVGGGIVITVLRPPAREGGDFRARAIFRFFLATAIAFLQYLGRSFTLATKLKRNGDGESNPVARGEGRRWVFGN